MLDCIFSITAFGIRPKKKLLLLLLSLRKKILSVGNKEGTVNKQINNI